MLIVIYLFIFFKKWCSDGNAKTGLAELNRKCHRDPSCSVALSALLCEVLIAELVVVGRCQTGFIFNLQRLPKKASTCAEVIQPVPHSRLPDQYVHFNGALAALLRLWERVAPCSARPVFFRFCRTESLHSFLPVEQSYFWTQTRSRRCNSLPLFLKNRIEVAFLNI